MKTRNLKPKRTFWQRLTFQHPREVRHYACATLRSLLTNGLYHRLRRAQLRATQTVGIDLFDYTPGGLYLRQSLPAGMASVVEGNNMSRMSLLWGKDPAFLEMEPTDGKS